MSNIYIVILITVIPVLVILGLVLARRQRTERYQNKFGTDYDHTVKSMGNEKKAQTEMDERQKHVDTLNIRPLSISDLALYPAKWTAIQAKFIDQPGLATVEADDLIREVMRMRNYPVSTSEQRAADISINYPALVSNYRLAQAIALKNDHYQVDTEELRQALGYYRSLFDELLKTEAVSPVK
jgi:hypothetical protein